MRTFRKKWGRLAACLLAVLALLTGAAGCGEPGEESSQTLPPVDFTVTVEEGKDPVILQLSDPQFIDLARAEEMCYRYMRETIQAVSPDLILVTGDLIYGHMDDDGSIFEDFIRFMEGFGIPWAPIFGNHDAECEMGADWMCERLEEAEHCLFLQRTLTGNGNYSVGIVQGGALRRVFFMLDTNGCSMASSASLANGHTGMGMGIEPDQMRWFVQQGQEILEASPQTKVSFCIHIPMAVFAEALEEKYGFTGSGTLNIDALAEGEPGDFGYVGEAVTGWD